MSIIIILILAVIAAALTAWVFLLKKENDAKNKDFADISAKAAVLENENKNLSALNQKCESELKDTQNLNESLKNELSALKAKEAELKAVKQNLEDNFARQQASFDKLQASAKDNFRQLADEVFKTKISELKTESKEIVAPLNTNLEKLHDKLSRMQNLNENLQKEAANLTKALQFSGKTQGNFGEMILEEVLEACGLKKGVNYEVQATLHSDEGKPYRPDCIVNLPDQRYIVIDSKMSLTAYTKFVSEEDSELKAKYLQDHIESIEKHIKELSAKKYQDLKEIKGRTPDFVMMFVPIEYAYMAALDAKRDLGIFAGGKRIAVVTASSLIPILKTVESLWRISTSQKEMDEIIRIGSAIHTQAASFLENMQELRNGINKAGQAFNKSMTSLDGGRGILLYAKKLEELGVKGKKNLPQDKSAGVKVPLLGQPEENTTDETSDSLFEDVD
ncbi:DNA recombination protein RmuC [Candidatus Proelusimicrobium volucris]|uniref:DNA recombination protein RmuC n=1 Tax=Candidatus Proelusimicrobium volucris TaxID=3416225 RepID=UPI003D13B83B